MKEPLLALDLPGPAKTGTVLAADVAVPLPVEGIFSYSVPAELEVKAVRGVRVTVPFENREMTGYITGRKIAPPGVSLKPLIDVLDDAPVLSENILALTEWIGRFYGSSWGEAIENALPKWVKYGKKAARSLGKKQLKISSHRKPRKILLFRPASKKRLTPFRLRSHRKTRNRSCCTA